MASTTTFSQTTGLTTPAEWAIPDDPDRFFTLLKKPDLTGNEVDELFDAAGKTLDEVCEEQWRALCRRIETENRTKPTGKGCTLSRETQPDFNSFSVLSRQDFDKLWLVVCWWIYKAVNDWQTAEDLAQESFVKAILSFDPRRGKFKTLLFAVATNQATDYLRCCPKAQRPVDPDRLERLAALREPVSGDTESHGDGGRVRSGLVAAMDSLCDSQRRIIEAELDYPDATIAERARLKEIPLGTAYVSRQRALENLRNKLGGDTDNAATT